MFVTAETTPVGAGVTGVNAALAGPPLVTLTTTSTTTTMMTTATAPQAMRAPEGRLGRAPGLPLTGGRAAPPPRPPLAGPLFLAGALADTGLLCWRLRSLAETPALGVLPPGFGVLPPPGARLFSAIVPASPKSFYGPGERIGWKRALTVAPVHAVGVEQVVHSGHARSAGRAPPRRGTSRSACTSRPGSPAVVDGHRRRSSGDLWRPRGGPHGRVPARLGPAPSRLPGAHPPPGPGGMPGRGPGPARVRG